MNRPFVVALVYTFNLRFWRLFCSKEKTYYETQVPSDSQRVATSALSTNEFSEFLFIFKCQTHTGEELCVIYGVFYSGAFVVPLKNEKAIVVLENKWVSNDFISIG